MSATPIAIPDEETVLKTITKLLDKAGRDPRLTPRILREKAEQRLTLSKGDLKFQREKIKELICDWWNKQKAAEVDRESLVLKSLVKLARVSGNVPHLLKGLGEMENDADRIKTLRERLRGKGLKFSDVPTEAETQQAEKEYNLKKDLDGIDPALIVSTSRTNKRPADASAASGTVTANPAKQAKVEPAAAVVKTEGGSSAKSEVAVKAEAGAGAVAAAPVKSRIKAEYSDEEAEF